MGVSFKNLAKAKDPCTSKNIFHDLIFQIIIQKMKLFTINADVLRSENTVRKFQDFSVIQILREINFEECRSSKTAFFAISGALNFVDLVDFSLQKVQNFIKTQIQGL